MNFLKKNMMRQPAPAFRQVFGLRWRLSQRDNSARFQAGGTNGPQVTLEKSLRRRTRRHSSQRDEFHLQWKVQCKTPCAASEGLRRRRWDGMTGA
jgi:hypothetical protein